ncbi:hypothetical protein POVCU2_0070720 [Plasmodium ovale curtisi]|uniref:Uncharacterized protein n=1 Tax=Plasmodium ovale curtisi TaxID=864141 RepID=A0A1A8XBK1_PLAOA|nr:hypothetical protein POVCU2_0070720 [Plasmodium ovale curtisi]SBT02048.1 hypothetical protein POVCU1_072440 [Plasmodium ovale curtisi]
MLDDEDDGECIDTLFINENDTRGDLTEVKIQGGKSTLLIEQNTKDVPSPHGLSQEPTSTVVFGISTGTETLASKQNTEINPTSSKGEDIPWKIIAYVSAEFLK